MLNNTRVMHEAVLIFGIEIDKGISGLIRKLWVAKVRTYFCCQGDKRMHPFVTIHKDDLEVAKEILPPLISVKTSNESYIDTDQNGIQAPQRDLLWLTWGYKERR